MEVNLEHKSSSKEELERLTDEAFNEGRPEGAICFLPALNAIPYYGYFTEEQYQQIFIRENFNKEVYNLALDFLILC